MSPRPVFTAAYMLAGASALWTAYAIATLFGLPQFIRHYQDERQDADAAGMVAGTFVVLAAVMVAVGLTFLLLAALDAGGSRAGRVITWILAIPAAGFDLLILIGGRYDPVPWWGVLTRATGGISLLLVAAALTLLCLPRSRAYFRKPPPPPLRYPVGFRPPYAPY